jgi:glycosyltransferase involved in cell wall biosynthesis
MNSTTPRVSLLLPVYNTQRYIAATVESILKQTFTDFEFIIIDDGSTDRSPDILRRYAQQDQRIRLICRENQGLVATLNEGLDLARADLLARIDADDLSHPDRLALQVQRFDLEPNLVLLGSCAKTIDDNGEVFGDYNVPLNHDDIEARHLQGHSSIHHPAAMMRCSAVQNVGRYRNLVPCEDFDLWLRLGEVGHIANLPQPLLYKRMLVSGGVVSGATRRNQVLQQIMLETWQRRNLPGQPVLPATKLLSQADFYRQWGWMALKEKNRKASSRFARKALLSSPLHMETWKLAYCALRGR